MKTVNVTVTIQMDIKGDFIQQEVLDQLELINNIVGISEIESQPQIFIGAVDMSDIKQSSDGFEIGDLVAVPKPDEFYGDTHTKEFWGEIIDFVGDEVVVVDEGGNIFNIDIERI